ncbi:MAG: FAD-dependent oxidoreductase, partial [Proteobacteria bacterium]|nr:FAD-dependent oxidoreductase [Pseudomonadota bacterium]
MSYPGVELDAQAWQLLSPADYINPTPQAGYHLVVAGAGPAGLISAIGAAGLGAKVALVERHRMGGDCLNVGCMPSKSLLAYTEHQQSPDFDAAFKWLRQVRADIAPHDSVQRYTDAGVDVFFGDGVLNKDGDVCVDDLVLKGRRVAICTGARAAVPPIPGLRESDPLTNESVFDLHEKPQSLAILGAGAIGCELAQVFARLGVRVELFELAARILPNESELASATVAQA